MVHEEDLLRERIHTLIHRENISRREFAIKVGKPVSNIYEILSGKRGIPEQTIGQCLGHSWSRHVTARYIAHDQRKVDDAVRRVVALISSA